MTRRLPFSAITADAGLNPRDKINFEVVTDYADAMRSGANFPPLIVFFDGKKNWLSCGFHRHAALEQIGAKFVDCDIRTGTREDAIKFALGCNTTHGLRRSNADKRHAVELALREFPNVADAELARWCAVSQPFVSGSAFEHPLMDEAGRMVGK